MLPLVHFVSEPVQNFLNQYKIFWTGTKYVTMHGKTYLNAYPLDGQKR